MGTGKKPGGEGAREWGPGAAQGWLQLDILHPLIWAEEGLLGRRFFSFSFLI
jgi:hypothetical protein